MVARNKALNEISVVALGRIRTSIAHGFFDSSLQAHVGQLWYTIDHDANSITKTAIVMMLMSQ